MSNVAYTIQTDSDGEDTLSQQLTLPIGSVVSCSVYINALNIRPDIAGAPYVIATLTLGDQTCGTTTILFDTAPNGIIVGGINSIVTTTANPILMLDLQISPTPGITAVVYVDDFTLTCLA
jgi:hypothetical protein